MKNVLVLCALTMVLTACSSGNDDPPPMTPQNQPPLVASIADQSIVANVTAQAIDVTATDDMTLSQDLMFAISSDNEGLIPPAAVVIDANTMGSALVITPTAGQIGIANLTLTVTDGSGASSSASFAVTVNRQPLAYAQFLREVFSDSANDLPRDINSIELTGSDESEDFSDLLF